MSDSPVVRTSNEQPVDPVCEAIYTLVQSMCAVTVGESTGFYNSRTCNEMRATAKQAFITAMNKESANHVEATG